MRKIWLDDMRTAPAGYEWVKNYHELIAAFEKGPVDIASLDHDLDIYYYPQELTGYDVVKWIVGDNPLDEDSGRWPKHSLAVHTDNPSGRQNMMGMIERYGPYAYKEPYEIAYGYTGVTTAWGFIYYKEDPNASKE